MTKFKIGDRIRITNQLYQSYPLATVTEITERGFKYRHDEPITLGYAYGYYQEGEAYNDDYWELVTKWYERV